MRLLGKDGILYMALAIVISILAPIICVICAVAYGIYKGIKEMIKK